MEVKQPDLDYSTIEITTSAIHAKVYPSSWEKDPNPRQLFGIAQTHNFATLSTKTIEDGVDIEVKGFGPDDKPFYQLNKKIQ